MPTMTETAVKAAIAAIESETATATEKIEMLLEMAMGLQKQPKDPEQLYQSIALYQHAIALSEPDYPLFWARAMAGMATALRTIPSEDMNLLLQARALYEKALPMLQEHASPEEVAEAEMNLGLVLQSLVASGNARLADSIQAYQRALRVFTGDAYPQEYAILQNNIAIAYLSMPLTGNDIQQGMAVQTFEQALRWITVIDHPSEYAMLQNNLGNALQYLPSTHPVENNWKAIAAYDEALKVRTIRDTPLEYANTIANKANALSNLPDDPEHPEAGNPQHLQQALQYYQEASDIFNQYGYLGQVEMVMQAMQEIEGELGVRG
jgi:tetratricopeptide (TPR) repeat protein